MPELRYLLDGARQHLSIPWALDQPTVIGSENGQAPQVLAREGVLPRHVTIIKLPVSPSYVLLDHAAPNGVTQVNDLPVLKFKIIRHGDRISFGQQRFVFSEFQLDTVDAGSPYLQEQCPVVDHSFELEDEAVICRCGRASHLECWLVTERCTRHDCAYLHRNLLVKFLQDVFFFETLTRSSPLIGRMCNNQSGYPWDEVPFAADNRQLGKVAYCPRCKTPYHESCWFSFESCPTPNCGYDVREKVLAFFVPETEEGNTHGA